MPDILFPGADFGIPILDIDCAAQLCELPFTLWGSVAHRSKTVRTWGFYVDDYKFNGLWSQPDQVLRGNAIAACEPNFSIPEHAPLATAIWQTYRKRWLARYWQQRGLRIYVDLNVSAPWDELNLSGVPHGWRAYCTRAADYELDRLHTQHQLARQRAGTSDLLFLVYSGGQQVRNYCQEHGLLYLPDPQNAGRQHGTRISQQRQPRRRN